MFLGFVWDASSMTKESLNSNARNTFYYFVIPEESLIAMEKATT
jgi:hypothetical protein